MLALLLVGTAVAYLWNLSVNGWANSFYAAAVQSGAKSWKAFFFGSSDWANAITVDKTPASLWPMEISARLFGMNSWSMLVPQVLLGVASVALVWVTVRRVAGPGAGLIGGLALAVTPVAALMFRFDNPDALLVFLMLAAVWAMTRAVADGRWRWLVLCGALVGLGFLAKQLQVLLVVPALALTYLIAGPPKLGKRLVQLVAAGVALVAGAGWWVLIAQLWPADSRPYFGGSQHNSIIELTLGYNGLDRVSGGSSGSFPGPPPGSGGGGHRMPGFGSDAGIGRLFTASVGGQIGWLIPAALVLFVVGIVLRGRASRVDPQRAALILWGGWALITGLVFSFMKGLFHQYYTVALAPAVAGTLGVGVVLAWRERDRLWVRCALASTAVLTAVVSALLLSRTPDFVPWLRWVVLAVGILGAIGVLFPAPRRVLAAAAVGAVAASVAGPAAYSVQTIGTAHTGGIVLAGPSVPGSGPPFGPPGGANPGQAGPGDNPGVPDGNPDVPNGNSGFPGGPGSAPGVPNDGSGVPGVPGDGQGGPGAVDRAGRHGPGGAPRRPGDSLVRLLRSDAERFTWAAAAVGSMGSADLQLAAGYPVMSIGGFGGGDPSPTLEQFQRYVGEGKIHFFLGGDGGGPDRNQKTEGAKISRWVRENFSATTVDGETVYDLTARHGS
ncbi:ArnT family glycosyltransferase [Nocardia transvalensis]|nr:glycosyltransferase family 39 protein [Nocardia transvalensis]